jgi:hypothetical protein
VSEVLAGGAIATMARTMLALVFLQGFAVKLGDPARLAGTIADYRLLPAGLARPAAWLLLAAEAAAGALLLAACAAPAAPVAAPVAAAIAAAIAAVLLALFVAAMAINLCRGRRHISCGCHARPTPLSWRQVWFNLGLLLAVPLAAQASAPHDALLSAQAVFGGVLCWAMLQTGATLLMSRQAASVR